MMRDVILGRLYWNNETADGWISLAPAFADADRSVQIDVMRDWIELLATECDRLLSKADAVGRDGTHRKAA